MGLGQYNGVLWPSYCLLCVSYISPYISMKALGSIVALILTPLFLIIIFTDSVTSCS